jgi:hypothetical protein
MTRDELIERLAETAYGFTTGPKSITFSALSEGDQTYYRDEGLAYLRVMAPFVTEWLDKHYQQEGDVDFLIFQWKREMEL